MKVDASGDQGGRVSSLPRIVLAAFIGLAIAVSAFANAVVNVTRTTNPGIALAMPYTDPIALAASADQLVTGDPKLLELPFVERAARKSLAGQALNPRALRLLGYVLGEKENHVLAGRLIRIAEQASRREVSAQLWLIEDCVARGDVSCSIEHYDVAMRTQPETRPVLFPILIGAMDEPEVRRALAVRLRANPQWQYEFINQATATIRQPSWLSATLMDTRGLPGDPIYRPLETNLLGQLVAKDEFEAARRYLAFLSGGTSRDFEAVGFNALSTNQRFSPLSWQTVSTSTSSATFEPMEGGKGFALHILAGAGESATMARRLLFLAPGIYRLQNRRSNVPLASDSVLNWVLHCANAADRRAVWSGPVEGIRSDISIVSTACAAYMLELNVSAGSDQEGLDIKISDLDIRRVG